MRAILATYRVELLLAALLVAFLVAVGGCNSLGVTQLKRAPGNLQESLLIAAKSGDGMTVTFMQLRVNRTISSTQYDAVLEQLQELHDVTQKGIDAYKTALALCVVHGTPENLCGFNDAQTALDRADIILGLLAQILAQVDQGAPHGTTLYIRGPPALQSATLIYLASPPLKEIQI